MIKMIQDLRKKWRLDQEVTENFYTDLEEAKIRNKQKKVDKTIAEMKKSTLEGINSRNEWHRRQKK